MKFQHRLLDILFRMMAQLPFGFLYLLSDFSAFLNFHIIRYRKKVVLRNLQNSFPEKSKKEIKKIALHFYRNLSDVLIELLKMESMTSADFKKRFEIVNGELFDKLYAEGKSVLISLGHCGNWEWIGNRINLDIKYEGFAIYKPLSSRYFNDRVLNRRKSFKKVIMIDHKRAFRNLVRLSDQKNGVIILADQSPAKTEINFWATFLGQETAFYQGVEKIATALNYAVVYLDIVRQKRGHYRVEIKLLTDDPLKNEESEITTKYIHFLEETIRNNPDNWLWSHKRWKFKKEELT